MRKYKNLPLLLILAIGACRSTSSEWSCRNLDSKVGCANISKADDAYLENGKLSSSDSAIGAKSGNLNITQVPISKSAKYSSSSDDINVGQIKLIRSSEKIGRVWIAPYMDGKGNYHEGSFIRVVDEISRWEKIIVDEKNPSDVLGPKVISVIGMDIDLDDEEVVNLNQPKPQSFKSSTSSATNLSPIFNPSSKFVPGSTIKPNEIK